MHLYQNNEVLNIISEPFLKEKGFDIIDKLRLIIPDNTYKLQAQSYIEEFKIYNSKCSGSGNLEKYDNYDKWLEHLRKMKSSDNGNIPRSTFFAIRECDNIIIGMVNIRHKLDKFLLNEYGNIGYAVRPTQRNKGYANQILQLALIECKKIGLSKVLLVCAKNNIASEKVIKRNGGIYWNERDTKCEGKATKRYWIYI